MIEFAISGTILFMLTVGLVDVGRAFYMYNELASAARFGARWGAVQGGTCGDVRTPRETNSDWCNSLGSLTSTAFWAQTGNTPAQGNASCPATYVSSSSGLYSVTGTASTYPTSIVGVMGRKLDTSSSSSSSTVGNWAAGLDPNVLKVCIQLSSDAYDSTRATPWEPAQGDWVTVYVYYPFKPAGGLLGSLLQMNMVASSRYEVE